MPQSPDEHDRPSALPWPPILLAGALIGAIALGYWVPLPWPGIDDLAARVIGWGFGIFGLVLVGWSLWTLKAHNTTVLPNKGAESLVTSGPYAQLRNPIYLGDTFVLLGLAELTHNIWFAITAAAFAVLVTWLAILPEERHLTRKFGDTYRAYVARTRRWI